MLTLGTPLPDFMTRKICLIIVISTLGILQQKKAQNLILMQSIDMKKFIFTSAEGNLKNNISTRTKDFKNENL